MILYNEILYVMLWFLSAVWAQIKAVGNQAWGDTIDSIQALDSFGN